ncbi:MAG: DeoR/GlpR family DNA-binding transcription regulator [Bifidobacteriaceae bacterium]|jgi:DeoR/GlpR family transcriptional regulator of sugar metabolism|nr:DeoR/GlpR family DNA-binding transcription regulator [Bifidobacteriaceae bacterium]
MAVQLAHQRRELILERLHAEGAVRVSRLSQTFGVSQMTVRRDIETLAARGLCFKVHGGASRFPTHPDHEPAYETKARTNGPAKRAIAQAAAALVSPGQAVAISGGSTAVLVATQLAPLAASGQLTIVTNSLPAADRLASAGASRQTILTGGVCTASQALVGPVTEASVRSMHFDWFFLGVHGMTVEAGLTSPNVQEAATNQAIMAAAAATAVVADASKWGLVGLARIAPLDAVNQIYTSSGMPPGAAEAIRQLTQLTIVKET